MNSDCIPSTIYKRDVKDSKEDDFESIMPKLLIIKKLNFKRIIGHIVKDSGQKLDPRLLGQLLHHF